MNLGKNLQAEFKIESTLRSSQSAFLIRQMKVLDTEAQTEGFCPGSQ